MAIVSDIFKFLCAFAPLELQMSFDNSGFLVGRGEADVSRCLMALDITSDVVSEAEELGAQLIISHHPLIFGTLKAVRDDKLLRMIRADINAVCMHTNLDICQGGVNDVLIELLSGNAALSSFGDERIGRISRLSSDLSLAEFLNICKKRLSAPGLRYYDAGRSVSKLAVLGGSGADYLEQAAAEGCDTFVTADVKHHQFLQAAELGINLVDAGHYCTEAPIIPALKKLLSTEFEDVEFLLSERQGSPALFF